MPRASLRARSSGWRWMIPREYSQEVLKWEAASNWIIRHHEIRSEKKTSYDTESRTYQKM